MAIVALETTRRDGRGKGPARQARFAGGVPAVLYGLKEDPVALTVDAKTLDTILSHGRGNLILEITTEPGGPKVNSIVREIQREPVSGRALHVDFQRISLTERIQRDIPVHLSGTAVGVKDFSGILDFVRRELTVEGLPTQIPNQIEVDVTSLMIGDAVFVRDLSAPNIRILTDPDMVVVHVVPPAVYQEEAPAEAAAATTAAEPEVVAKGKEKGDKGDKGEKGEKGDAE